MALKVPIALLLDRELTAATKVVWMLSRLHPGASPPPVSLFVAQSGLAPDTIRRILAQITERSAPSGDTVNLPIRLLTDPKVIPSAKVLYGILQDLDGPFTYPSLSRHLGAGPNALKRAVAALIQAEWLETKPRSRVAPVEYTLCDPVLNQQQQEVKLAWLRIQRDPNKGEAIMKEFLSLLVDSTEFEDNARPGFLINPKTKERLELDRYYINTAAFEYNGESHFGTTDQATDQQTRDLVKVGICALRQIPVVIVHSEDLSLDGMRTKIGYLLPLRDLTGHEPLIAYLERRGRRYREEGTQQNT